MFTGGTIAIPDSVMSFVVESFQNGNGIYTVPLVGAKNIIRNIVLSGKVPVGRLTVGGIPYLQTFSAAGIMMENTLSYVLTAVIATPVVNFTVIVSYSDDDALFVTVTQNG